MKSKEDLVNLARKLQDKAQCSYIEALAITTFKLMNKLNKEYYLIALDRESDKIRLIRSALEEIDEI